MKKLDLSIIIVSYNTADLTAACVRSILDTTKDITFEVIVVDNDSHDSSVADLKAIRDRRVSVIENKENLGFAKANNIGVKKAQGRYLLFLNSDTIVYPNTLERMVAFMETNPKVGAATCRLKTPDGGEDYSAHRGFPTPWNAFTYFSGLASLFPKSKLFSGYTQGWKDRSKIHEVDAISGAFMFTRQEAGEQIGWWDEDYFFNGEDLDFCYKLKHKGWKILYIPDFEILHYNGMSGGTKKKTANLSRATKETRARIQDARFDAMKIFYKKHFAKTYPRILTNLVLLGVDAKRYVTKKRLGL